MKQEDWLIDFKLLTFLECDDGTFGTDCSGVCGHCHRGAQCDKSTGMCASGCAPGYEGIYCNKSKISVNMYRKRNRRIRTKTRFVILVIVWDLYGCSINI